MKPITEVARLAMAMVVPAALFASFPYQVIGFKAKPSGDRDVSACCRFVELTWEEESAAMAAARTSWATDSSDLRRVRLDLINSDMIDSGPGELIAYAAREYLPSVEPYRPQVLPESVEAPDPGMIAPDGEESQEAAFPKSELLNLQQGVETK